MNVLSNKFGKRSQAFALHLVFCNFHCVDKTPGVTHPMASGPAGDLKVADLTGWIDAEAANIPTARGPYRKMVDEISNRDGAGQSVKPAPVSAVARWCAKSAGNSQWRW
jgi:hypothetical protein